jgi:hypothetical protein
MGAQIPVITEKPLAVCGCHKFKIDALGDHLCTCTAHSGVKKAHDWTVDQLTDLFRDVFIFQGKFICSRLKKKAEVESKNCHTKTMLSLEKPIKLI